MAHIHLPDGSFTLTWVLIWWFCALVLVGVALLLARRQKQMDPGKITIAAFVTAASFAIFQVQIPLAGGVHLNLTPLIGILAGPVLGALIVFVVNILSAAIGHGGWGLVGANVLVNFSEVLVAYLTFRSLKWVTSSLFARAGIATFAGLFVGNIVMMGIILISGIQGVTQTTSQILVGLSLLAAVNMGVAVIEAIITGLTVAYIGRVRPEILDGDRG
ncbi:MAG TPA: energy-coupling factor ABC transporter permease [Methanomicrobiales archaeon]|nr:energy-coupling factor ABC transporter permease [Methanomicrobiales archaeon]